MKFKSHSKNATILALILFFATQLSLGQSPAVSAPREDKLLNGLKTLVWHEPKAEKITVKLRIHSGSAFDPLGKEGVMRLLSEILFPNESMKEFFAEDLGGSLEIISNYDYIQINATGDPDKALQILEIIANAVTNPQINKESTGVVRSALLARVKELERDPAYVADQAVAKRLLGDFPYGRPQLGSSDSLARIDFADLLFAKERFLTADNSTLAITGNIKPDFALRAARRFFGGWLKSDKRIPATFAQPEAPSADVLRIQSPAEPAIEVRTAWRGTSRGDRDFFASQILVDVLRNRLAEAAPSAARDTVFVRHEAHLLPGLLVVGYTAKAEEPAKRDALETNLPQLIKDLLARPVTEQEFARARTAAVNSFHNRPIDEIWLDADTFKLPSAKDEFKRAAEVRRADVQRVLDAITKTPMASVLLEGASPKAGDSN